MKFKKGDIVKYNSRSGLAGLQDLPEGQKLRGVILGTKFADCDVDYLVHVKWATIDELDWVFEEYLCLVSNEI
jgi:hypothetical protein